jgi:hypothetical protein
VPAETPRANILPIIKGCRRRTYFIQSVLNKCACRLRPEGPPVNSPGRQAGVKDMTKLSAEGAAREAPMVPRLQRSIASQAYPGLTALRALLPYEHSFVTLCIEIAFPFFLTCCRLSSSLPFPPLTHSCLRKNRSALDPANGTDGYWFCF